MYFGPGSQQSGVVVVCTIGKGIGGVTYNMGVKVGRSRLTPDVYGYWVRFLQIQRQICADIGSEVAVQVETSSYSN
jgi:hypothetical protein